MPNKWTEFVKDWAAKNNMSYGCAMTQQELKDAYKAANPKPSKSTRRRKNLKKEGLNPYKDLANQNLTQTQKKQLPPQLKKAIEVSRISREMQQRKNELVRNVPYEKLEEALPDMIPKPKDIAIKKSEPKPKKEEPKKEEPKKEEPKKEDRRKFLKLDDQRLELKNATLGGEKLNITEKDKFGNRLLIKDGKPYGVYDMENDEYYERDEFELDTDAYAVFGKNAAEFYFENDFLDWQRDSDDDIEGSGINNPELYKKAQQLADEKYKKPSAYKSGFIVKKYKELGGTYSGKKPQKTGIARWFIEEWKDIGNKDYPVYRPTKRITKDTPLTASEIDPKHAKKQIALKQKIKGTKNLPPFMKGGSSKGFEESKGYNPDEERVRNFIRNVRRNVLPGLTNFYRFQILDLIERIEEEIGFIHNEDVYEDIQDNIRTINELIRIAEEEDETEPTTESKQGGSGIKGGMLSRNDQELYDYRERMTTQINNVVNRVNELLNRYRQFFETQDYSRLQRLNNEIFGFIQEINNSNSRRYIQQLGDRINEMLANDIQPWIDDAIEAYIEANIDETAGERERILNRMSYGTRPSRIPSIPKTRGGTMKGGMITPEGTPPFVTPTGTPVGEIDENFLQELLLLVIQNPTRQRLARFRELVAGNINGFVRSIHQHFTALPPNNQERLLYERYFPTYEDSVIVGGSMKDWFSPTSWKDYASAVVKGRNDYPPKMRAIIEKYGDTPILRITACRTPVPSLLTSALNAVSFGEFNKRWSNLPYDQLFHLDLRLELGTRPNLTTILLEKNEVLNASINPKKSKETECSFIPKNKMVTLNQLLEGAKKIQGDKFFKYSAYNNNCQDFIMALLQGSGLGTKENVDFIKQDTKELFIGLPGLRKFANTVTDIGATVNTITQGRGSKNKFK